MESNIRGLRCDKCCCTAEALYHGRFGDRLCHTCWSVGVVNLFRTSEPGGGERRESPRVARFIVERESEWRRVPGAGLSVGGSGEAVSTRTEVVADGAKQCKESLGVLG